MNRTAILAALLLAVVPAAFAGGGAEPAKAAVPAADISAPGEFPIVKTPTTIRVFIMQVAHVENFENNEASKYMEKLTGVKVAWQGVPEAATMEKLNLVLASGDYPDFIVTKGIAPEVTMRYASQGIFVPLNDMIARHGVNFRKMLENEPGLEKALTAPGGKLYGFPYLNDDYHGRFNQKMWINREWLQKLGLPMPRTTEDFYRVLKAFKEKDPNGNGKADEVAFSAASGAVGHQTWSNNAIPTFLMNSFIYWDKTRQGLYLDNGKVTAAYDKPKFREGLRYYRRLYAEGLIDPAAFTQNAGQLRQLAENPDVPILGAFTAGWYGAVTRSGSPSKRDRMYEAVPPLEGPGGFRTTFYNPYKFNNDAGLITKAAQRPEVVFKWADHILSVEGTLNVKWGPEGKSWRWAQPGETAFIGGAALFKGLDIFGGQVQSNNWGEVGAFYQPWKKFKGVQVAPADFYDPTAVEYRLYVETSKKYDVGIAPPVKDIMPPVYVSPEAAAELAQVKTAVGDFVLESTVQFIIGEKNLDRGWDDYLAELKNIGLARYLELMQKAYEAQWK